jgi:hypothetical protein
MSLGKTSWIIKLPRILWKLCHSTVGSVRTTQSNLLPTISWSTSKPNKQASKLQAKWTNRFSLNLILEVLRHNCKTMWNHVTYLTTIFHAFSSRCREQCAIFAHSKYYRAREIAIARQRLCNTQQWSNCWKRCFHVGEMAPGAFVLWGWVDLRAGLEVTEKKKNLLPLTGIEPRHLVRPARSLIATGDHYVMGMNVVTIKPSDGGMWNSDFYRMFNGARGSVVGWGTRLQARR